MYATVFHLVYSSVSIDFLNSWDVFGLTSQRIRYSSWLVIQIKFTYFSARYLPHPISPCCDSSLDCATVCISSCGFIYEDRLREWLKYISFRLFEGLDFVQLIGQPKQVTFFFISSCCDFIISFWNCISSCGFVFKDSSLVQDAFCTNSSRDLILSAGLVS